MLEYKEICAGRTGAWKAKPISGVLPGLMPSDVRSVRLRKRETMHLE